MIKALYFLCILLITAPVFCLEAAQLYKCGNDTFQQMPCDENEKQQTLTPDTSKKGVQFSKPKIFTKLTPQSHSDQRKGKRREDLINSLKRQYESANKLCRTERKALKEAEQRVIDNCKKSRDVYCNKSPQEIADKNYNKAAISSLRPGWSPNHELNGFSSNSQYCQEAKRVKKQLKNIYGVFIR